MKLTDVAIRRLMPKDKPYKVSDGQGLFLLVTATGSRWWRLKYRWAGKEKLLSLGIYPHVSLAVARTRRDEARALLAVGTDPSIARQSAKESDEARIRDTFHAIAEEWLGMKAKEWVPAHGQRNRRRLEIHIFPWLGKSPIRDLTAADFLPHLKRIEHTGAIETAHRVLNLCSQIMRYAVATDRRRDDPTRNLAGALPAAPTRHFAAVTDPQRLGPLLLVMDGYRGSLVVRAALKLAPLLFVRPGELRSARWADISFDTSSWTFTSTKLGVPMIVPLATQAIATLRELHALTGRFEYVFPNARSRKRPMSEVAVLAALRSLGIGKEEMCGHGFRATARTILDEVLNVRPDIIEQQLSHVVKGPLGRAYTRTEFLPARRDMMQSWADYLDSLKADAQINSSNVKRV
jgi:integrase